MVDNERIIKIEKEIQEIKDYHKKLEKAIKEGFDEVLKITGKHSTMILDIEKRKIHSDEVLIEISQKINEIEQWKIEHMRLFKEIFDIVQKLTKTLEKLQARQAIDFKFKV